MNPLNQVNIEEEETTYKIGLKYHTSMLDKDYDAEIIGVEKSDGTVTIRPNHPLAVGFVFENSDPDRVIAIAQMMLSFAQMVKNNNSKIVDISTKE